MGAKRYDFIGSGHVMKQGSEHEKKAPVKKQSCDKKYAKKVPKVRT